MSPAKATEPRKSEPVISPASLQNLLLQLEEAGAREGTLNDKISKMVEREAKFLAEHLDAMNKLEESLRP